MSRDDRSTFRGALSHRDYRWLASAFIVSNIGSWAYNVALVVWVFDRTGSVGWASAVSLARFLPALVFSAYGGVLAERFERRRLVIVLNLISGVTHVLLSLVIGIDAAIVIGLVLAALSTIYSTIYEPAIVALTPQIVGERDLAAANSLNAMIDNGAVVVGPALGAILLVWFSPEAAVAVNAATFFYAAFAAARVSVTSRPSDVTEGGGKGPLGQMVVGFKALAESAIARFLVGFSVAASFFYGTDTVVFVVLSDERLGTDSTGYGYLLAALGVGGVIAAPLVNRLASMPKLGTIIAVGMAVYTLPTAALVVVESPTIAFILQVVRGAGTLVVDVLAITAMQRTLARDLVARVFGVYLALVLAAISLGAFAAPVLIDLFGLDPSLLILGLVPAALLLTGIRRLRAVNEQAAERLAAVGHRIDAFEASPLFAALTRPGIEQLAAVAEEIRAEPGTAIVTQGERADAVYLIAEGRVAVSAHGDGAGEVAVAELGAGDYFGEIGILEEAPRNATCTAIEACDLFRVGAEEFLAAVHHAPATGFLDRARHRSADTHRLLRRTSGGIDSSP